jgi:hypothetical protein
MVWQEALKSLVSAISLACGDCLALLIEQSVADAPTFIHSLSGDADLMEEQTASSSFVAHLVMNGQMSENSVTPEKLGNALGLDIGGRTRLDTQTEYLEVSFM